MSGRRPKAESDGEAADALVVDTNVLVDMKKPDTARDVTREELLAARRLLSALLEVDGSLRLGYSQKMLPEWKRHGVLTEDMAVRLLVDLGRLVQLKELQVSRGQRRDMGEHVDPDDQIFVFTAAVTLRRELVTRDPKITKSSSRRHVKRVLRVCVETASEYVSRAMHADEV